MDCFNFSLVEHCNPEMDHFRLAKLQNSKTVFFFFPFFSLFIYLFIVHLVWFLSVKRFGFYNLLQMSKNRWTVNVCFFCKGVNFNYSSHFVVSYRRISTAPIFETLISIKKVWELMWNSTFVEGLQAKCIVTSYFEFIQYNHSDFLLLDWLPNQS